jgi:hypothetical protein
MHTSFFAGGTAVNPRAGCNPACTANRSAPRKPLPPSTAARYTLALMAARPGPPNDPPYPDPDGASSERYGPLELRRLVKDDGRALIVYSHAEGPEPPAPEGPEG